MMQNKKIIIGITGGTGAGKTTVSDIFRKRGVPVFDADLIAREIVEPEKPALAEIAKAYDGVICADGTLNRKKLGSIVFSDKDKLAQLNSITHKYITQRIHELIEECNSDVCAIDGAVLIESGVAKECDALCAVTADEDIRKERIIQRDGLDEESALKRIRSQKSDVEYAKECDYIIYNNGDIGKTEKDVDFIINKILKEYK